MTSAQFDIESFFCDQMACWPMVKANYDALAAVERRVFEFDNFSVQLQFNPARKRSTAANISAEAIRQRACFLCAANRPSEQMAIGAGSYDVLVNPFPIFSRHLTIVSHSHEPQSFLGHAAEFQLFAKQLPDMAVFFNGAHCGASAPDHLHFQASPACLWPLLSDIKRGHFSTMTDNDRCHSDIVDGIGRTIVCITTDDTQELENQIVAIGKRYGVADDMMNIIAHGNQTIVVPRRAFRPWQFSTTDESRQLMVSPASVEVGGIFITPVEEHFMRMTSDDILSILSQVCF